MLVLATAMNCKVHGLNGWGGVVVGHGCTLCTLCDQGNSPWTTMKFHSTCGTSTSVSVRGVHDAFEVVCRIVQIRYTCVHMYGQYACIVVLLYTGIHN
jgi:hypothetical protein